MTRLVTSALFVDADEELHAHLCADAIKSYWAARGHSVDVRVEAVQTWGYSGANRIWTIRSDLKMGRP